MHTAVHTVHVIGTSDVFIIIHILLYYKHSVIRGIVIIAHINIAIIIINIIIIIITSQ